MPPPLSSATFSEIHHPQGHSGQRKSPHPLEEEEKEWGRSPAGKPPSLLLFATTSCVKIPEADFQGHCWFGPTLPVSLPSQTGLHDPQTDCSQPLSSLPWLLFLVILPGSSPSPKSHRHLNWFLQLILPFLPSDLTITSVTSNLEPNYGLAWTVLWLFHVLTLIPQLNYKLFRITFVTNVYLLNSPHYPFPPVTIRVLSPLIGVQ